MTNVIRLSNSCGDPEAAFTMTTIRLHFLGRAARTFHALGMNAREKHQQRILEPGASLMTKVRQ